MKAGTLLLAQAMMVLGQDNLFNTELPTDNNSKVPMKEPMPLTAEEVSALKVLTGKEKRFFIKKLKEKYGIKVV